MRTSFQTPLEIKKSNLNLEKIVSEGDKHFAIAIGQTQRNHFYRKVLS